MSRQSQIAAVVLVLACLRSTEVRVQGELRTFSEQDETTATNDVDFLSAEDGNTENYENVEQHPHLSIPDKPSKFDFDITKKIMTDDKSMYQIESSELANSTSTPEETADNVENSNIDKDATGCSEGPCDKSNIEGMLDRLDEFDTYNVTDSVQIVRTERKTDIEKREVGLFDKIHRYAKEHVVKIQLDKGLLSPRKARTFFDSVFQGKSTFLTGFGLGFLAFGLKKLLLPLFFGVQIIKSVLLALFLPSIIGSIGNIVGKGVSSFAQSSHPVTVQPEESFEFKDNSDLYNDDYLTKQPVGTLPASAMYDESMIQIQKGPEIASRYSFVDPRITHANHLSDRYYSRNAAVNGMLAKKQDFKVFHEIPTSSLLLTNYDPFYSPLLSRLDAVFSRLGHTSEPCREYAVCAMYRSPARYAPYSNLVSAQLSRELNELRKPASDNPDVLRFFRYMKAAKDGQDGVRCEDAYGTCSMAQEDQSLRQNQAMLATYQDIDKLVHARKL